MSAALALTLALLGPGVADKFTDEARCHWVEQPLAVVPRRVKPLATVVRAPYVLTAGPKPAGKRLARVARPGFDYVCDESGALRADGPVALAIAESPAALDEAFALPTEPTGAGQGADRETSAAPVLYGPSVVYVAGLPVYVAAVPEPSTWALMVAGFALIAFRRRRAWGQQRQYCGAVPTPCAALLLPGARGSR